MSVALLVVIAGIQAGLALRAHEIGSPYVAGYSFVGCVLALSLAVVLAAHQVSLQP